MRLWSVDYKPPSLVRATYQQAFAPLAIGDLVLLQLGESSRILVKGGEVVHVVRGQGEYHRVLAHAHDGLRLLLNLWCPGEVSEALGDDYQHSVILPNPLRQGMHEVQGNRVFLVDEEVGLVYRDDGLPAGATFLVVFPISDYFLLKPTKQ